MDPISVAHTFVIVVGIMGFCFCCDRIVCKKCIHHIKNNPNIFTPPTTPDSNHPPPNSPCSSTESNSPLPSPATMKPDYSSSEEYIDIYIEYSNNIQQHQN
jgi:hypothetical protein